MDHIERFEDLVTSIKANGVSNEYLFCKLFTYSLGGEAAYWLKQLPTRSLKTWEEAKKYFLCNFYDDARSEDLRNNISQFTQGPTEAFKAAWVLYQMALDSASNGNFNTRSPGEAEALIENLTSSNSTKNADFERQKQSGSFDGKQIAELKNTLDSVHNILVNKKSVQFAEEVETFEPADECEEEDVNYIGETGFQNQRYGNNQNRGGYNNFGQRNTFTNGHNSSGYAYKPQYHKPFQSNNNFIRTYGSSSYQAPHAQPEQNEMKAMLEQILEGQQKITVDFNGKIDVMYTNLNGKLEALNTHVKNLDTQVAQTAGAMKRQDGTLLGRTYANPRYQCNAITLRSGKELNLVLRRSLNAEKIAELEEIEAEFEDGIHATRNTTGLCRDSPVLIDEDKPVDVEESEVDKHEKSEDSNKSENLAKDKNEYVLVNTYTRIGHDAEAASKQKSEKQ
ncbi:hypothetical protein V5N11_009953 [Cardamine amara subsp. amara]|uniref:Retrotransposon gag domain-containing protein n=1 Tax=Cardamine amara subsp. amara TaxID=228776 RepID=A0ABD1B556_CARAN